MHKILIIVSGLAAALVVTPASADWVRVCGPYQQVGINATGGPHFNRTCWDKWVGSYGGGGGWNGSPGYRGGYYGGYGGRGWGGGYGGVNPAYRRSIYSAPPYDCHGAFGLKKLSGGFLVLSKQ